MLRLIEELRNQNKVQTIGLPPLMFAKLEDQLPKAEELTAHGYGVFDTMFVYGVQIRLITNLPEGNIAIYEGEELKDILKVKEDEKSAD